MNMDMGLNIFFGGLLGLMVGSFANVVIHRLPLMLEREWAAHEHPSGAAEAPAWNLAVPASHCPRCQRALRWHENIPVLSYLLLRGRCAGCGQSIAWRYPLVELLCGALIFNMMGSGLIASSSADLTEPILLSAAGMTVSALILIGFASQQENH